MWVCVRECGEEERVGWDLGVKSVIWIVQTEAAVEVWICQILTFYTWHILKTTLTAVQPSNFQVNIKFNSHTTHARTKKHTVCDCLLHIIGIISNTFFNAIMQITLTGTHCQETFKTTLYEKKPLQCHTDNEERKCPTVSTEWHHTRSKGRPIIIKQTYFSKHFSLNWQGTIHTHC